MAGIGICRSPFCPGKELVEVGPRQSGGPLAVEVEELQVGVDRDMHCSYLSVSHPSRDGVEDSRVMTAFQWGDKPLIKLNAPRCVSRSLGLRRTDGFERSQAEHSVTHLTLLSTAIHYCMMF